MLLYYEEKDEQNLLIFIIYLAYLYFHFTRLKKSNLFLTHYSVQNKQKQMNKEKPPKEKQQKTKPKKHNKKTKSKQNPNTHEMNKNNTFIRPT